jgi:hypothetical protein
MFRVVDLNPDRAGSASFCRIRIGAVPINSRRSVFIFHENFNLLSKILKILTHLPLMAKEKHCKLTLL